MNTDDVIAAVNVATHVVLALTMVVWGDVGGHVRSAGGRCGQGTVGL